MTLQIYSKSTYLHCVFLIFAFEIDKQNE